MKKIVYFVLLLVLAVTVTACSKDEIHLTKDDDIKHNTLLIKRDGTLQVAIVEDFDKDYYNLGELNEFISKEIQEYSSKAGSGKVVIEDLSVKNGKVVMLLNYAGMEHYSNFNHVLAAYFSVDMQQTVLQIPDHYMTRKGTKVDRATAFEGNKNRALVVYEPYEIIVDGEIKYYSENGDLYEKHRIKSAEEGATVVIYRPEK